MKKFLSLLLALSTFSAFSQTATKEVELTYLHKHTFPHLFKAGDRERLIQFCTLLVDSVIQGTVNFNTARVGDIKNCKFSIRIITDTVRSFRIETSTRHNTKRLKKDALAKYGNTTETITSGEGQLTLKWEEKREDGHYIISTLTIDRRNRHGILTSKME